jgi:hypothetical protein
MNKNNIVFFSASFTHTEISVGEVAENIIPVPEEASSIKQYACWAGVFVVACLVGKFVFGNQKTVNLHNHFHKAFSKFVRFNNKEHIFLLDPKINRFF